MPKVWYVAIVGRPNAGKSTLLNALIWEKVSAISPRPQTTQRSIPGIFTDIEKGIQIIFLDTPGIHQDAHEQFGSQKATSMNTRINSEAFSALRNADVIVRLVDPTRPSGAEDARIDEVLSFSDKPVLRIETKQDLGTKSYPGKDIDLKIDSINRIGFDEFLQKVAEKLPEWPYLYDEDQYTDQTMDLRIMEVIREQLFHELGEEIPYACYVDIGSIENGDTLLSVQVYIHTETDSQKTIVIGKQWKKIQEIGTKARLILEDIFGKKVFLGIRVKVQKNWRKDEKILEKVFPKR
jgi:GTPase